MSITNYFVSASIRETQIRAKDIRLLLDTSIITSLNELIDRQLVDKINNSNNCGIIDKEAINRIEHFTNNIDKVYSVAKYCKSIADKNNVKSFSCLDSCYPSTWKVQNAMPIVAFYKGDISRLKSIDNGSVAVVGSRKPSKYALDATVDIVTELVESDITIVSGLALGIDACAHVTTLRNNGNTIAIIPGGPESVYPWQNKDIFDKIEERGLIISELLPGQKVMRQYFPARNRLISGLSDATLVMEASEFSGTLHTASFAAMQGKEVYVLPNSIYATNAIGGLKLIQDGAQILLSSEDVIDSVRHQVIGRNGLSSIPKSKSIKTIETQILTNSSAISDVDYKKILLLHLQGHPRTMDELIKQLNIQYAKLSILLSELELERLIYNESGRYYLDEKTYYNCKKYMVNG